MFGDNEKVKSVTFKNGDKAYDFKALLIREDMVTVADDTGKEITFTCSFVDDSFWVTKDLLGDRLFWKLVHVDVEQVSKGPSFCMWCGEKLHMRYPGGDPENGPASLRCKDDRHSTVDDEIERSHNEMTIKKHLEHVSYDLEKIVNYSQVGGPKMSVLIGLRLALDAVAKQINESLEEHDKAEEELYHGMFCELTEEEE